MSNQSGLKHVPTEPTRLETKRECRRGAAGRAAALRRAPSDSDCSGETASLSADSGDRAIRPAPQPPPRGKSRSRRRGSEWEVLEGLKDGQRFEKRPEVFNGYLHKKRKWPLKGWHKRFFVVDGGILVYARSPTDVARGRLHGSVDVGLSVISAKARRRRIDIDADEFIYHLRAKTPDVFRTWLTVLKAHRLYRQHLLTFGARESVPKIHAPLEDLPPTDTSSRSSQSGIEISTLSSLQKIQNLMLPVTYVSPTKPLKTYEFKASRYGNKNKFTVNDWSYKETSSTLLPLKFDELKDNNSDIKLSRESNYNESLMISTVTDTSGEGLKSSPEETDNNCPVISLNTTDAERHMHSTELELSLRSPELQSSLLWQNAINTPVYNPKKSLKGSIYNANIIGNSRNRRKAEPVATYCFSTHKVPQFVNQPPMKRSKKSTNLVKYRNMYDEPPLKNPYDNMLLGNYCIKMSKDLTFNRNCDQSAFCNIVSQRNVEIQTDIDDKKKYFIKNVNTDLDKITEQLMRAIFDKIETSQPSGNINVKSCINQVVKELYDSKTSHNKVHPVIALFKSLLEYWLKNTSMESVREAVTRVKSIDRQSVKYFTKDQHTSSLYIENINKKTQFHSKSDVNQDISRMLLDIIKNKGKCHKSRGPHIDDNSEKERRIQEIEKFLKNTVYICGTPERKSIEKDIRITRTLIDSLEKTKRASSDMSDGKNDIETSNSSSELPKIQDTLKRLISETSLPVDIAKGFLNAYLDVLHDSKTSGSSPETTDDSKTDAIPKCDVQTDSIERKASKGITTTGHTGDNVKQNNIDIDTGQMYLKSILDNITTIFCKRNKQENISHNDASNDHNDTSRDKDELGNVTTKKSVVIDLSSYNLEHVTMTTNPDVKEITTVTIKLKEKHAKPEDLKSSLLRLKFSDVNSNLLSGRKSNWTPVLPTTDSNKYFEGRKNVLDLKKTATHSPDYCTNLDLKPYLTNSDATSKEYRFFNSDHSLNLGFQSSNYRNISKSMKSLNCENDTQSCYILSSLNKYPFQSGKKIQTNDTVKKEPRSVTPTTTKDFCEQISMFENTPKIIDEKFILLLLENLTLLSKNLPAVHKEINSLYLRLHKKYDKIIKNDAIVATRGLGLLGKIYNDEVNMKQLIDNETQYDNSGFYTQREAAIKTSNVEVNKCDKSLTADQFEDVVDKEVQTDGRECKICSKGYSVCINSAEQLHTSATQTATFSSLLETVPRTADKAISNQNWYRRICTKDFGIGTLMKYVLDTSNSTRNFKIKSRSTEKPLPFKIDKQSSTVKNLRSDKGNLNKVRQDLIKEITLRSPSFKVSTQSQTVNAGANIMAKEFKVYELFTSGIYDAKVSSSMFELNENAKSDDLKTLYRCTSDPSYSSESGGPLESASRELGQAQLSVQQLQRLLDALELHQQAHHDTDVSLEGASPNVKKDRRKFGLRKKKSNNKCASVELAPPHIDPSASHMTLSALTAPPSPGGGASSVPNSAASLPIACAATRPQSLPGAEALGAAGPTSLTSLTPDHQLREDFTVLAKDLVASLKSVVSTLVCERGRLRAAMDASDAGAPPGGSMVAALRSNLSTALQQNNELRARLTRIHDASDLADLSSLGRNSELNRQFQQSLSYSSSCVSASEFFDAEEHDDDELKPAEIIDADEAGVIELDGDSSSEAGSLSSEEGSASSDNSDAASIAVVPAEQSVQRAAGGWARRTGLPAPRPTPGGPSLWNLLYKNIGKDLSQISMPVTINEPLNMLQRLCEELEYSELLDAAAACASPLERMALVAAFAVSSYAAAAHRAASKPFNPLLAETYECVREDRGFRFLAEQVSHHPPISACHAESPRWCFWQEARIKTKFWGKSMEFQPAGRVHVRLLTTGDHYSWNKVTTCVHNLFGGQRWVDQYGDMHITCHGTDITCKLNFVKASSWSSTRHEVRGAVAGGVGRLRLQGRWSEALHAGDPPAARCLWRPGAMPPEHEAYYGFTRFAMELNELEPGMRELLPHTDTRLRPDQRALEEGDVDAAEQLKHELEQAQRERRRDRPDHTPAWFRKAIEGGEETWVFTGEYWRARDAGFPHNPAPRLW